MEYSEEPGQQISGTDKLSVATELLTQSARLFFEGAYFASLHLAGAAEELFGVYITNAGGVSSFKNMRRSVVKLLNDEASEKDIARLMNHAKNRTKHMYPSNDDVVRFDARTEAGHILDRAISDYYQLINNPLCETEWINRFNQARFSF